MLGLILFFLILLFFGFILSLDVIKKIFQGSNAEVLNFLESIEKYKENDLLKLIFSLIAIITGIWNFFAPDFGANLSPTIIGATIPSVILIFDGLVIYPDLLLLFNITEETKNKVRDFIKKFESMSGIITFVAAILHIILFKVILF